MKTLQFTFGIFLFCLIGTSFGFSQAQDVIYVKMSREKLAEKSTLKTYLIERKIPGAGELSSEQLQGISQKSCSVIDELGPGIVWLHSYVTGDKVYCLYRAENEAMIREHAKKGGFPADYITEMTTVIDPETAR